LFEPLVGDAPRYTGTVWGDMRIQAENVSEPLTNVLTGETVAPANGLRLSEILADLPAAVLLGQS
jgi:maltooligosyltrehalose synthase